jgi:hypothetical protein
MGSWKLRERGYERTGVREIEETREQGRGGKGEWKAGKFVQQLYDTCGLTVCPTRAPMKSPAAYCGVS